MLATYSVGWVSYSDAMIVVGQSQPLFKAAGGGQTIGHLTRSAGYRYLKKMIVSLVWSKKNNKEKRLFVVFFDLNYLLICFRFVWFLIHKRKVNLKKWRKMIFKISSNFLILKQFFVAFFHVTSD